MKSALQPIVAVSLAGIPLAAADTLPLSLQGNTSVDVWGPNSLSNSTNPGFPGALNYSQPWPSSIPTTNGGDAFLAKTANGPTGAPIPSGQSIYFVSFSNGANTFGGSLAVNDNTPLADLATLAFQIEIGGANGYDLWNNELAAERNLSAVKLHYTTTSGATGTLQASSHALLDKFYTFAIDMPTGPNGEDRPEDIYNRLYGVQWDLSSVGPLASFKVEFSGVEHAQLYQLRLDQSSQAHAGSSVFPSDAVWTAAGGDVLWSTPGNWQEAAAPGAGRNIRLASGSDAELAPGVSAKSLTFATPGSFHLSGSSPLTLSSGINSSSPAGTSHHLAAPVILEKYNLFEFAAGNTMTLSGGLSGVGFYKQGPGNLVLTSDNTYDGTNATFQLNGLIISGGDNTITGTNTITGDGATTFNIRPDTTVRLAGGDQRLDSQFTANLLGATSRLILGDGAGASNQTFSGLTGSVSNVPVTGSKILGGSAAYSTLSIDSSVPATFAGDIGGAETYGNHLNIVKTGEGTQLLTGATSYLGTTVIREGALGLDPAGRNISLNGGVLVIYADRSATLADGIRFDGAGGFAAHDTTEIPGIRSISLNGDAMLAWGSQDFLPGNAPLLLSAPATNSTIRLSNPLDLGNVEREVRVNDGFHATDATLSAPLSGTGTLTKTGPGTLSLTAASPLTGTIRVHAGYLMLTGSNGKLSGGLTVEGGAFLRVTNAANENLNNRLSPTSPLTLRGGYLTYTAVSTGTAEQTGPLQIEKGANTILTSRSSVGSTTRLGFTSLSHLPGSTLNFSGAGVGLADARNQIHFTNPPALANDILGGWVHVANEFATLSSYGVTPLSTYTTTAEATWLPTQNVKVTNTQPATLTANRAVHSLRLVGGNGGHLLALGGNTLRIHSGGLLANGGDDSNVTRINNGTLTAGTTGETSPELYVITNGPLDIAATIADPAPATPLGLVKSGSFVLTLDGATTHTGPTTLNQGTLKLGAAASLATTPLIQLNTGSTFDITARTPSFPVASAQTLAGSGTVAGNLEIRGTLAPTAASGGQLAISGDLQFSSGSRLKIGFEPLAGGVIHGMAKISGTTGIAATTTLLVDAPAVDFTSAYWKSARSFTVISTSGFAADHTTSPAFSVSPSSHGSAQGVWSVSHTATTAVLHWSPAGSLAAWRQQHFGTTEGLGNAADNQDPDHDGIPNLLEFALGTNPRSSNGADGHTALPVVTLPGGVSALSFSHPEPSPDGLRYEVQATSDLTTWKVIAARPAGGSWSWQSDGPSGVTISTSGGRTQITVADETITPASAHRFFRLKAIHSDQP